VLSPPSKRHATGLRRPPGSRGRGGPHPHRLRRRRAAGHRPVHVPRRHPPASATRSSPATGPSSATGPSPALPGPPAGSQAEAAALARLLLSRVPLPPGARPLPQTPLPPSLRVPAAGSVIDTAAYLDQYRLFAIAQPMNSAAACLAARVPPGLSRGSTGQGAGPGGITMREVGYLARSAPAGIASAQLVLTIVPVSSGGSLLRADAQVTWYPARSAAEYLDPARYHVLSLTVTIFGRNPHTVHRIVTSQAFIARLAETLDRLQAEPIGTTACPADFEDYQLSFSVSRQSRPAVVVSATETGCGGVGITVNGHSQPPLADYGAVGALVRQVVPVTPEF
jgi:hypothetical protein